MRKILIIWACFMLSVGAILTPPAVALEVSETPIGEFAESAPILITAYQTAAAATSLVAVEIYNQADSPIHIDNWVLDVVTKDGVVHTAELTTSHSGVLLPGEHVVASSSGDKSTYRLDYLGVIAIATIELHYVQPDKTYRAATATIKDASDTAFFRTYTTTGYSTASQPFAATPARAFYDDGLYIAPESPVGLEVVEFYPYASDCAPNDQSVLCGDYVKLKNNSEGPVSLDDLALRTDYYGSDRSASNTISLSGTLQSGATVLVNTTNTGAKLQLTNSGGYAWLEDAWGMAVYKESMQKYESAGSDKQGYAYAQDKTSLWQWTTTPTPVGDNVITAPVEVAVECPVGKYRNPDTGRCRTIEEAVNALTECDEGYERNPVTNRCRKIATLATATLTPCAEGQERNPATNRCRTIASAVAELLPCDEGYERNPDTHRCRKIKDDTVPAAAFPVTPIKAGASDPAGWYAFAGVSAVAASYAAWEWRAEIAGLARRIFGMFSRAK